MPPVITVFGATGAHGGGLARAILADPHRRFALRAVTRAPASAAARALAARGADVVAGEPDDPASVRRAMEGAHAAFCATPSGSHFSPQRELARAETMARAALDAGVRHVVRPTFEDTRTFVPPGSGAMPLLMGRYNVPHFDARGEANASFVDRGVPTTLLYASFAWDDLVRFCVRRGRGDDGRLALVLPTGDARLPGIAAADVGPCAFGLFTRGDAVVGKSVGIAGEHLSGAQMAEQLALALREPVVHLALTPEDYADLGFPGADALANMFRFARDFERLFGAMRGTACTRELHPGVRTFAGWLAENLARLSLQ